MVNKIKCEFCKKEILPINWERHQNTKTCREHCFEKCGKIACFHFEGNSSETHRLYCGVHKLDNMVDVTHPKCKLGCGTRSSFNYEGETKRLYCSDHGRKLGMVDVVSPRCKLGCGTQCKKKYRGYCFRCFIRTFPDEPVSRNYKTKELYVADFVKNNFHDKTIICDKVISGGCSKRRPDIMIDFGYQILIVEVDEGQHELYETTCEEQRINDIYTDLGDRPIVLIRFNPDGYKTKNGNITSCWGPNKRGITVVKKSKKKEWEQRLSELKEKITYWCHKESNEPLITEYLFFDKKK